jgi:hypothetical protein
MRRSLAILLAPLALFCACQFPGCPKGQLEVTPQTAWPGDKVRLHQNHGGFSHFDTLRVVVGRHAAYTRLIGDEDADVMVPLRASRGPQEVRLFDGGREIASTQLALRRAHGLRVVLKIEGGTISVLRTEPCGNDFTGDVPSLASRLSFDIIDDPGNVLYTGSILHPLNTEGEVFSRSGSDANASRVPPPTTTTFWVRVPNQPSARDIRVYDVAPGISLADSAGRASRQQLGTLALKDQ